MIMKLNTLLFMALALAANLFAADEPNRATRSAAEAGRRLPSNVAGPLGGLGAFDRVLTDGQRQKLREYTQANNEKTRAGQQEAMRLRRELQQDVMNGKAGEAAIKAKTDEIAKLEAAALAGRMNALAQVAATLTPEQKEQIKQMSEQSRAARPGLGAGPRGGEAPGPAGEPAAPPPPAK
jgi:Spy/CpxP family protein refolding chaperone